MKNKIFTIIVLLSFFTMFLFMNPVYIGYTAYTPVQSKIELNLIKTDYNMNEPLSGTINLTFNGPVTDDEVIVEINGQEDRKKLSEILSALYKPFLTSGGPSEINDKTTKELEFDSAGTKRLAIKIPKDADLSLFSFRVKGKEKDNSYPEFPKIDIIEDNILEFAYLGLKEGWSTTEISSLGLNKNIQGADTTLSADKFYCELINLPYSKDFKIIASYILTSGIVKGKILKAEIKSNNVKGFKSEKECTFTIENSKYVCDLLDFDKPIHGENLVCIYSEGSVRLYSEFEDENLGYYGYTCDREFLDESYLDYDSTSLGFDNCAPVIQGTTTDLGDFLITVQPATYSGKLTSEIPQTVEDLTYINDHLQDCNINPCIVYVSISSDSKGIIKIFDLQASYGIPVTTITKMWDVIEQQNIIHELNGQDITDQELIIPLSIFNITTPSVTQNSEDLTVAVSLGAESDEQDITVYKIESADAASLAYNLINKLSLYTDNQKEIASSLGHNIDTLLTQIDNYEQQIQNILNSTTLTDTQKDTQLNLIKQSLENIKQNTPTEIKIKKSIKNLPVPRATEVSDIYLSEPQRTSSIKQQILNSQSNIQIKTDLINFDLTINNTQEEKTLVKKTITGVLSDIYLIEEIPKTIASSINEISFGTSNFETIQADPVVRWSVNSLPVTITYAVPNNVIDSYSELKTIVIPKTISPALSEAYQQIRCGDKKCTTPIEDKTTCPEDCMKRVNWWFVIILLALLIGGIYYLNFYKGKISFKKITTKKPTLFKSKADENNLRNYVKRSIEHGIPKSRIKTILLAKGWSENQINHILRTL